MKTNEVLKLIDDKEFIDKVYQYSYRRCSSSYEAEDLCSDIILSVISAVKKTEYIENFYAFVWTVAKRVYADFCEKRSRTDTQISLENCDLPIPSQKNEIDEFIEESAEAERLKRIFKEIAFLSKAYRDVMVMFYIDELSVKEIAARLNLGESAVKQRLFSARNTIRKEVKNMENRNLSLKPIRFQCMGTGNPVGNEPHEHAERLFSQNLIYLCKDKAKSAKELSEELCVPMPFIEEELELQCRGANGEYGMLRKLENGKYISNVIIVDHQERLDAGEIYKKHLPELCDIIKARIEENKEKILALPYFSKQDDMKLLLWPLIHHMSHSIVDQVGSLLTKHFADITPSKRPYTLTVYAYTEEQWPEGRVCYGCDGIYAEQIGGYQNIHISNIYGPNLQEHFHCGHNISTDPLLLMTIRSIGGLDIETLSESEKEIAAKAIDAGYIRKNGNIIEPKIIVLDRKHDNEYYSLANPEDSPKEILEEIATELASFIKSHIPEHLMNDYRFYSQLIAAPRFTAEILQKCIDEGIINKPANGLGAEGILMTVKK